MDHPGGFDFRERVDELRCHETAWLRARRDELRREQQRLRVEELAVTRVLDERRALGDFPDPTVASRTAREHRRGRAGARVEAGDRRRGARGAHLAGTSSGH